MVFRKKEGIPLPTDEEQLLVEEVSRHTPYLIPAVEDTMQQVLTYFNNFGESFIPRYFKKDKVTLEYRMREALRSSMVWMCARQIEDFQQGKLAKLKTLKTEREEELTQDVRFFFSDNPVLNEDVFNTMIYAGTLWGSILALQTSDQWKKRIEEEKIEIPEVSYNTLVCEFRQYLQKQQERAGDNLLSVTKALHTHSIEWK